MFVNTINQWVTRLVTVVSCIFWQFFKNCLVEGSSSSKAMKWKTSYENKWFIRDALRNFVSFVQLKKREKHLLRSRLKSNTPPWVFFTFFKLYKWYQIAQSITYSSLIAQLLNCFWQEIEQSLLAYWYNLICTFFRCDSSPQWTVVLILKWVSVCILVFACLLNFFTSPIFKNNSLIRPGPCAPFHMEQN